MPSLADLPVLNKKQSEKTFFATFHTDCGNNYLCECQMFLNAELLLPKTPGIILYYNILIKYI